MYQLMGEFNTAICLGKSKTKIMKIQKLNNFDLAKIYIYIYTHTHIHTQKHMHIHKRPTLQIIQSS